MGHTLSSRGLEDTLLVIRAPWEVKSTSRMELEAGPVVEKMQDEVWEE